MARNEEKHYCRLNRVLLQQEKEELEKKHPKRPRLDTLASANEIKQWIPSIKKELEFCLAQSQVPCYSESKIEDFQSKIQKLECEFKAFVRKTKQLDPETNGIPWTNRPYKSQNGKDNDNTDKAVSTEKSEVFVPIRTPILDGAFPATTKNHDKEQESNLINGELIDKPLLFCAQDSDEYATMDKTENGKVVKYDQNTEKRQHNENTSSGQMDRKNNEKTLCVNVSKANGKPKSILGLDYSSSDSDSDEM